MLRLDFLSNDYQDTRSSVEKTTDAIAIEILTGILRPGRHLAEQQLCTRYGLSRTPIREVLKNLESLGLIELIPNRGAIVRGLPASALDDLFYMKALLYPQCVRWAIERITPEEFSMLEETFAFMEFYTATDDMEKMQKINRGFEAIIYNACHNREMESLLLRYDFFIRYANADVKYPINYLSTVLEEHRAIFEAFRTRNPEAGQDAAQAHIFRSMLRRK